MKKNNQGFTLIELIIVIVILGILAVTAAPRFLDLTGDARASTVDALEGSIQGAANIVNAKFLVAGLSTSNEAAANSTVDINNDDAGSAGTRFNDNIEVENGFPSVQTTGLLRALDIDTAEYIPVLNNTTAASATAVRFYPEGVTAGAAGSFANGADCYVSYTEAAANGRPGITSVTTDCN